MGQYLCLSVTFLNRCYHGEEWPASPIRTFQAIVAGAMNCADGSHAREKCLEWLQGLPAPRIVAERAQELRRFRISVPNNDMDVVAKAWANGKEPVKGPDKLRSVKLIPPKWFLSDGPHIHYVWECLDLCPDKFKELRSVVGRLHTLGWGIDAAFADIAITEQHCGLAGDHWIPVSYGTKVLRIPIEGTLAELQTNHLGSTFNMVGHGVDCGSGLRTFGAECYALEGRAPRTPATFELRTLSQAEKLYSRGAHESMRVAAWLRHATGEALRKELDEATLNSLVYGHVEQGDPSHRLSYVPLPSIGHAHADGRIRRAMIVPPSNSNPETVGLLRRKLAGATLHREPDGQAVCALAPPSSETVITRYTAASHRWQSITPLVLHGFNMQRGRLSLGKTEKLIVQAFTESGYEEGSIRSIAFQPAPLVAGSVSAGDIAIPKHLAKWPRYHIEIEFTHAVCGPVLAGIGRHCGIGVFAAL